MALFWVSSRALTLHQGKQKCSHPLRGWAAVCSPLSTGKNGSVHPSHQSDWQSADPLFSRVNVGVLDLHQDGQTACLPFLHRDEQHCTHAFPVCLWSYPIQYLFLIYSMLKVFLLTSISSQNISAQSVSMFYIYVNSKVAAFNMLCVQIIKYKNIHPQTIFPQIITMLCLCTLKSIWFQFTLWSKYISSKVFLFKLFVQDISMFYLRKLQCMCVK